MIKKGHKNAYIVQKWAKNGQKKDAKRIYRGNFAHFLTEIKFPPARGSTDLAQQKIKPPTPNQPQPKQT